MLDCDSDSGDSDACILVESDNDNAGEVESRDTDALTGETSSGKTHTASEKSNSHTPDSGDRGSEGRETVGE